MMWSALSTNEAVENVREVSEGGKRWLVAPAAIIPHGVMSGSKGPLYYPADESAKTAHLWNGMPITVQHPFDPMTGQPLAANDDGVQERQHIGEVRNPTHDGKTRAELWFDADATMRKSPETYSALKRDEKIPLSTGLYTDNIPGAGSFNGTAYTATARNHRPDHLAVLPGGRGACHLDDGCGVNVTNSFVQNGGPGSGRKPWKVGDSVTHKDESPDGEKHVVLHVQHNVTGKMSKIYGLEKSAVENSSSCTCGGVKNAEGTCNMCGAKATGEHAQNANPEGINQYTKGGAATASKNARHATAAAYKAGTADAHDDANMAHQHAASQHEAAAKIKEAAGDKVGAAKHRQAASNHTDQAGEHDIAMQHMSRNADPWSPGNAFGKQQTPEQLVAVGIEHRKLAAEAVTDEERKAQTALADAADEYAGGALLNSAASLSAKALETGIAKDYQAAADALHKAAPKAGPKRETFLKAAAEMESAATTPQTANMWQRLWGLVANAPINSPKNGQFIAAKDVAKHHAEKGMADAHSDGDLGDPNADKEPDVILDALGVPIKNPKAGVKNIWSDEARTASAEARTASNKAKASGSKEDHRTAMMSHIDAAAKAQGDRDTKSANDHQEMATKHLRALTTNEVTMNRKQMLSVLTANCACETDRAALNNLSDGMLMTLLGNEAGHSLAGVDREQQKAAFAHMAGGGESSRAATKASKKAEKTGAAGDHHKAADAHRAAADDHKEAGNDEMAAAHSGAARSHMAAYRAGGSAGANVKPGNNSYVGNDEDDDREKKLKKVKKLMRRTPDPETNADDDDDDDDDDEETMNALSDPEQLMATINKMDRIAQLTSHITDPAARKAMVANLSRKSDRYLDQLQLLQGRPRVNNGFFPIFGAPTTEVEPAGKVDNVEQQEVHVVDYTANASPDLIALLKQGA